MTKTLLVVTGASRGLGKSIAKAFCNDRPCNVLLIARNETGLHQTQKEIEESSSKSCSVRICIADLANLSQLEEVLREQILKAMDESVVDCDEFIFINNAGSLGPIGPSVDNCSLTEVQQIIDFNVTSALFLSAQMAKWAKTQLSSSVLQRRRVIVNISSLVAVQAFPSLGLYSAGKAARDLYHSSLAQEEEEDSIQVLNYAPGPLETAMTTELRQAPALDTTLRPHYAKQLVDPDDSARKLVELLVSKKNGGSAFESGQHVDYYDLLEAPVTDGASSAS